MKSTQPKVQISETGSNEIKCEQQSQSIELQSIDWDLNDQIFQKFGNNNEVLASCPVENQIKLQDGHQVNLNKEQIENYLSNIKWTPPSFSDIQKSLQILKKAFPQTFTDKAINDLLKNLMKRINNHPTKPEQQVRIFNNHLSQNSNNLHLHRRSFQLSKKHFRSFSLNKRSKNKHKMDELDEMYQESIDKTKPQKGMAARLQSIWTQQFEELLLSLYKKGHQFSFIRDHFQEQYPQYKQNFTVNSLRGKFYKIIRKIIRKLLTFIDEIGRQKFPNMIRLTYNIIQNIMYLQEGKFLRMHLVDLYFCDHLNTNLVDRIIDRIVSFVKGATNQHADYRLIDL